MSVEREGRAGGGIVYPMKKLPRLWTNQQRIVLIWLLLIFCGWLAFRAYKNPRYVSDPQPQAGARAGELLDRLDPNSATWQELSVLPELGEKRAKEIVAYREEFVRAGRGAVAFRSAEDLLKIKGIGVSMVENLSPYLKFPP